MDSKTNARHIRAMPLVVAAVLAMALFCLFSTCPNVAHASDLVVQDASLADDLEVQHDSTCALLEASGFLSCCDSNGASVDEYWKSESASNAIYDLVDVETVYIASDVKEIKKFALHYQTSDGSVMTANNYTSLYSFSSLPSLKRVVFLGGSDVVTIRSAAFQNCKNLEGIRIPPSVRCIESSAFLGCNNLCTLKLSKGLEVIKSNAFQNCISLTKLVIPASVDEVDSFAFNGCYQLSAVRSLNPTPPTLGNYAFGNVSPKLKIRMPKGAYLLYRTKWNAYESELVDNRDAQSMAVELVQKTIAVKVAPLGYRETIPPKKAYRVKGAKGEVSYAQVSSNSPYITVGSNGAINVLSTTQKGPHILKVKVTAAGNAKYKPASKTVKLKIKVS